MRIYASLFFILFSMTYPLKACCFCFGDNDVVDEKYYTTGGTYGAVSITAGSINQTSVPTTPAQTFPHSGESKSLPNNDEVFVSVDTNTLVSWGPHPGDVIDRAEDGGNLSDQTSFSLVPLAEPIKDLSELPWYNRVSNFLFSSDAS